jgi:hypothetical protein
MRLLSCPHGAVATHGAYPENLGLIPKMYPTAIGRMRHSADRYSPWVRGSASARGCGVMAYGI